MALDFDDLEELEVNDPESLVGRLKEYETTGTWRCPKAEAAAKAAQEKLAAERKETDAKAAAKGEERRARREAKKEAGKEGSKAKPKKKPKKGEEDYFGVPGKPRVLFLHGVGGSKALWATQAKRLMAAFEEEGWQCITLEGQQACTSKEAVENLEMFFGKKDAKLQYAEAEFDERYWVRYQGNEDILDWMQNELEAFDPPIDGIVGFAQGANFAAMLAGQSSNGEGAPLKFVSLISPNSPGYARPLGRLFEQSKIGVPSFIVRGEQETWDVGMGMSSFLQDKQIDEGGYQWPSDVVKEFFESPEIFTHSGNWGILAPGKEAEEQLTKMKAFVKKSLKA